MNLNSLAAGGSQTELASPAALLSALRDNVAGVLLGKPEVVQSALVALLAEGHLLIEDAPGVGKTLLAKAIARSLDCAFHRIQFTPDLLPSDLIGVSVYNQAAGAFVFQPGPLFSQVVLADEINRATPRTQSALLEAMSERQVSVDGQTRPLGPPFFVLATQNPFEFEGTYPLPESQLDRFLMRLRIGYPGRAAEKRVLSGHRDGEPVDQLEPVLSAADLTQLQEWTRKVRVDESLSDYLLDVIDATRSHPELYLGGSTRAALGLHRAAQALALIEGRDYVIPDDIKRLARPVLGHRLLPRAARAAGGADPSEEVLEDILGRTKVPA
jgi:MoxR-like ATPase